MEKDLKRRVFEVAAENFETEDIKDYFLDMSEFIPDYFFTMPASTSGKYHSEQQCSPCGELIHAFMMQVAWEMLLELDSVRADVAPDAETRDLIRCFPMLHDSLKCGVENSKYTVAEHPRLAANMIIEKRPAHDISQEQKQMLSGMIATHSGQWNKNRAGEEIMPIPRNTVEKYGHYIDMFCSRKHFIYELSESQRQIINEIYLAIGHAQVEQDSPKGMTDPESITMPFGQYKGMAFRDIVNTPRGRDYLQWMSDKMSDKPDLRNAAKITLKNHPV